jgi:hypothetical protein
MRGAVFFCLASVLGIVAAAGCATSPADDGSDGGVGPAPAQDGTLPDGIGTPVEAGNQDSAFPMRDAGAGDGSLASDSNSPGDGAESVDAALDSGSTETGSSEDSGCVLAVSAQQPFDGGDCPAPVSHGCGPGSLSGFSPGWVPPTGAHQNACTQTEITQIYTDCVGNNSSEMACDQDQNNLPQCFACIFSPDTAASWGPIIEQQNGLLRANIFGCIALLEPCNLACAKASETQYECELTACEANCPVSGQSSETAYETCLQTADSCGCQPFYDPGQCVASITGSHPAAQCVNQSNFQAFYDFIAPLFCGP